MRFPKGGPQPVLGRGDEKQVNMVGHQAIRPHLCPCLGAAFSQIRQISVIITFLEKSRKAAIAALRYMMGDMWNDDSSYSYHI